MKPSKVMTILLFVGLIIGWGSVAMAGFDPTPFRFALGAERLTAASDFGQVLTQMVDEVLQVPFRELSRAETRGVIQATNRMARQLRQLDRLAALVGKDLLDTRLNENPSDEERLAVLLPLAKIADNAATIVALVEPYLGSPPEDQVPEFLQALTSVLQEAQTLHQNAVSLSEQLAPTPDR